LIANVRFFFGSIFVAFFRVFIAMVFLLARRSASCAIGRYLRGSGLEAGCYSIGAPHFQTLRTNNFCFRSQKSCHQKAAALEGL
jgi:hypothetical protein